MTDLNTNMKPEAVERHSDTPARGWPLWAWALVFTVSMVVALSFGTKPKIELSASVNESNQNFLWVVMVLQAAVSTFLVCVFMAIFSWKSALGVFGRLIAIALLCVVLFLLTVCASMTRTGWLGS